MNKTLVFSELQLKNYEAYEKVRLGGRYNMLTSQAIKASGLDRDDYFFVLKNYDNLRKQYHESSV